MRAPNSSAAVSELEKASPQLRNAVRLTSTLAVVAIALGIFSGAAFAKDGWAGCRGADPEGRIAGCSAVIGNLAKESRRNKLTAYLNRGDAYQSKGDYGRAVDDFTKALELNPQSSAILSRRAAAYRARGDADKALADLNRAVKLEKKSAEAYLNRGAFYRSRGDYDRAVDDLSEAIKREPKLPLARNERGLAFHGKGDFERAVSDFDEAIKLDPLYAAAYVSRANAWRGKHDFERAKEDLETALRLDPQLAPAKKGLDELNELISSNSEASPAHPMRQMDAAPAHPGPSISPIFLALVGARWLQFLSAMVLLGASVFPFYALPSKEVADMASVVRTMRRALVAAALVAALSAMAWVGASISDIAGGVSEVFDAETLSQYFFKTSFGAVWLMRLALAFALPAVALLGRRRLFARNFSTGLLAALAAALLVSQAWIGHPASLPGYQRWIITAAYALHVLAAGVWLGALLPLWLLVRRALRDGQAPLVAEFALWRFSPVGMVVVPVILAGGVANAVSRALSLEAFVASTWGRIVLFKFAIVLAMVVVAALNRFVLMPRLASETKLALPQLARNVALEQVAALVILGAAAVLGVFHPPAMMGMMMD